MKKAFRIILRVIIILMAAFIGFTYGIVFAGAAMEGSDNVIDLLSFLFETLLALFLAFNICVIIHEGGHLVFGLLTGYRFSSFRIWSLMLIKQSDGLKLRRFKIVGTGGQCLMEPSERSEKKSSAVLYNLGGVIFNLLLAIVCLVLYFSLPKVFILSKLLLFSAIFSTYMFFSNGIPLNLGGVSNDGMNTLHLLKDPIAAEALRKQLLMNAAQNRGMLTCDMPDEWFTLSEMDPKNVHCASIAVIAAGRPLDRLDTVAAQQEIEKLFASDYKIIGLHRSILTCDLISTRLINLDSPDVSELLTPTIENYMKSMRTYPGVLRTKYAIALLVKGDEKAAEKIKKEFEKAAKVHPYPCNIEVERGLMAKILEKYKNKV